LTFEPELPRLAPAGLAERVADRFRTSAVDGSRHPLSTREEIVEDGGLRFVVRVLAARGGVAAAERTAAGEANGAPGEAIGAAAAKGAAGAANGAAGQRAAASRASPFLPPYDPGLLIGAISSTHVCLLNKYNVVDRHLLIVTRELEDQARPLTAVDLRAAWTCLEAIDGLVFYNSGPAAGASQSHKHLQLVPFPLGPDAERFPFDRAIRSALASRLDHVPGLGYRHRLVPLRDDLETAHRAYLDLASLFALAREGGRRMAPYNLLMTRDWMVVVPRSSGACGPIEVNALGFAGALLVRGEEPLALVRQLGPRQVLCRVGFPA
jgi:ATP adenylyltransferase